VNNRADIEAERGSPQPTEAWADWRRWADSADWQRSQPLSVRIIQPT